MAKSQYSIEEKKQAMRFMVSWMIEMDDNRPIAGRLCENYGTEDAPDYAFSPVGYILHKSGIKPAHMEDCEWITQMPLHDGHDNVFHNLLTSCVIWHENPITGKAYIVYMTLEDLINDMHDAPLHMLTGKIATMIAFLEMFLDNTATWFILHPLPDDLMKEIQNAHDI